jgi:predicted MPP superfamily phosphohydrolase
MHSLAKIGAGLVTVGAGVVAYAAGYEVRAFRLRRVEIPCLPAGREPLRVLHLSDIHLTPGQGRKQEWLRGLAALEPDLVINTGDSISSEPSIAVLMDSLGTLRDVPGVFVFGSNDYWGPVAKNPLRYFLPNGGRKKLHGPLLPWRELRQEFKAAGWLDLTNTRDALTVRGTSIAFAGVDDPHLGYDKLEAVSGPADPSVDLRIGVTHAPYLRVLDQFVRDGYDLVFAGHTHGGQLRVPGVGALVTNCDLDAARSRGLSTHTAGSRQAWLHVSAGLGTSPYAPYRFACHPEATLLTLLPRPVGAGIPI